MRLLHLKVHGLAGHHVFVGHPPLRFAADHDKVLEGCRLAADGLDFGHKGGVGDDALGSGVVDAVQNVFGPQELRPGHEHSAQLQAGQIRDVAFRYAREKDDDLVPFLQPEGTQPVGQAVRLLLQLPVRDDARLALGVFPIQRDLGAVFGKAVDILCDVVPLWRKQVHLWRHVVPPPCCMMGESVDRLSIRDCALDFLLY